MLSTIYFICTVLYLHGKRFSRDALQVSKDAVVKRHSQGWITEMSRDLADCIDKIRHYRREKKAVSIGYHGNIVDLWWVLYCFYRPIIVLSKVLLSDLTIIKWALVNVELAE